MSDINLGAEDLNLLWVLHVLLEEQSATRAAVRLHVTQSAVSSALRRLRERFHDPLFVRTAHGFAPTPFATALAPALAAALSGVGALFAPRPQRRLTIACTDAVSVSLIPELVPQLGTSLPDARLRVVSIEHSIASDGLARGEIDLLIGIPPATPAGCTGELVWDDPMVCIVRRDHPEIGRRLSLAEYARLPHVELALFGETHDAVDRALARHRKTRDVWLAVPHFASIPFAVVASRCVATLSERLARIYARHMPLRLLTPPIELPRLVVKQYWHRRTARDPALVALRALVQRHARMPATTRSRNS